MINETHGRNNGNEIDQMWQGVESMSEKLENAGVYVPSVDVDENAHPCEGLLEVSLNGGHSEWATYPQCQKILSLIEAQGKSPRDVAFDDWGEMMSPVDDEIEYDDDDQELSLFSDVFGNDIEMREICNGHLLGGRKIA